MYNNYVQEYTEWKDRKKLIDLRNKLVPCYQNDDGSIFYVEPLFYTFYRYPSPSSAIHDRSFSF